MGYRKITNLHRPEAAEAILSLDRCYATEKLHGTSAYISYDKERGFKYFAGGIKYDDFIRMIDERFGREEVEQNIKYELDAHHRSITFYGEAYGGKCQRMANVYGPLNFCVFEVKLNDEWLNVPIANVWADVVGLPFVYWEEGPATLEWLESQRNRPSEQARRNGMGVKYGEGIVIRANDETLTDRFGKRIIAKFKREAFRETKTPRKINPEDRKKWENAQETANEFITPMRLSHVLDKLIARDKFIPSIRSMDTVIRAVYKDVMDEEGDDIVQSRLVRKAMGEATARLYKEWLNDRLRQ